MRAISVHFSHFLEKMGGDEKKVLALQKKKKRKNNKKKVSVYKSKSLDLTIFSRFLPSLSFLKLMDMMF